MRLTRRRLLAAGTAGAAGTLGALPAPAVARPAGPRAAQGVQSGDIGLDGATIWSRADRPARMIVEYATTEGLADLRRAEAPAEAATDFTARLRLGGLPPGQTIFYRARFEADGDGPGEIATGHFRTPPRPELQAARGLSFVWSADTVGQGWGINPDIGGMTIYETMRRLEPDFFVHCGDTIYADNPLEPEKRLPDGRLWKNLVTPAKEAVAETLDAFRGNHLYNLLDDNLRRFNAGVPTIALWDDHEVVDNWTPDKRLDADPRYHEKQARVLAARSQRAFREYMPLAQPPDQPFRLYRRFSFGPLLDLFRLDMRSHRGPNGANREALQGAGTALLGAAQLAWLKEALRRSSARWKIVAGGLPIGLAIHDDWRTKTGFESIANDEPGAPLGRELEIADLLAFVRRERIANVHWITGDVHYPATHRYDPERAGFRDFTPFYEFVSGPLCAGGFGPNALDGTFGPEIVFQKPAARPDLSPLEGSCHFGHVRIDANGVMTVSHRDADGRILHGIDLSPT